MRFLFRLIPLLAGLFTLAAFAGLEWLGERLWLAALVYIVLISYSYFELLARRLRERDLWYALAAVLFVSLSGMGFFLGLESVVGKVVVAIFVAVIVTLFSEQLYRWFYAPVRIPSYALAVTNGLVEIFTVFFLASDLIGLRIFLRLPLWILTPVFMVAIALQFLIARWLRGETRKLMVPAALIGLLFGQIMLALLYLPSSFMVGGALVAIVWYVVAGILRIIDVGLAPQRLVPRYLALGGLLIVMVAATARWI